ncbi:GntR family transcriptional regulator [Sulfitobacter sp. F26204]|uniref:GntR family transcriptional regulator n=1 Tax=Sulfitobacter sp. F26204 TaxID=2996014 RepID=UPI00225E48D6|nr:GntR family transcriptional regulator [Sulfitobacter sp. F26204]MCX7561899.1 GntR family transcriptional regulator [Sulfitobacter sp. F26204]
MSVKIQHDKKISQLQMELASKILEFAREESLKVGDALRESTLAQRFSVSRTPLRAALKHLCKIGAVKHIPQRGYFLAQDSTNLPTIEIDQPEQPTRRIYNQIVDAYFEGMLVDRVSEAQLMRRFSVERQTLQEALLRLSREGFMRQNPGYGWVFVPLQKSREADTRDMYRFRLVLEPAALLEPDYTADLAKIAAMRIRQTRLIESLESDFDVAEVFEANEELHHNLTTFSGNRYFVNALEYHDPSGRLEEYRHYQDRKRIRKACEEHIKVLDAVAAGNMNDAAELLRQHIISAQNAAF